MIKGILKVRFEDIEVGVVVNHRSDLGDISGLAESILHDGLLQPLVVLYKHLGGGREWMNQATGKKQSSRYILISGHRRYEAIKRIRTTAAPDSDGVQPFDEVPCVAFQGNETDAKIVQLTENLDRKDLNHVEQAEAYLDLMNCGLTQKEIAKRIRRSVSSVSQLVTIRQRSCTRVLQALAAGSITLDTALDISKIEGEDAQCKQLEKYLGTKREKGKAEAKRQTKKDTGGKARGSLKEAAGTIPLVLTALRKSGAGDTVRSRFMGAQQMVDYLDGTDDGDGIMQEAERILENAKAEDRERATEAAS